MHPRGSPAIPYRNMMAQSNHVEPVGDLDMTAWGGEVIVRAARD